MNETVKIVLSADFAAASCNSEFQTDSAIVLSGLRKKEYAKQRGLIEKLLDLGQTSTLDATSAKESGRTKNTKHNSENDSSRKDTKTGDDNVVQIEPEIQSYEEWRDNMIKKAQEQLKKIPAWSTWHRDWRRQDRKTVYIHAFEIFI